MKAKYLVSGFILLMCFFGWFTIFYESVAFLVAMIIAAGTAIFGMAKYSPNDTVW